MGVWIHYHMVSWIPSGWRSGYIIICLVGYRQGGVWVHEIWLVGYRQTWVWIHFVMVSYIHKMFLFYTLLLKCRQYEKFHNGYKGKLCTNDETTCY